MKADISRPIPPPVPAAGGTMRTALAAAGLAVVGSFAIAFAAAPSPTFLNQAAAALAWGALLAFLLPGLPPWCRFGVGERVLAAALLVFVAAVAVSSSWRALPLSLGLSAGAAVICALLIAVGAARLATDRLQPGFRLLASALLAAGAVSLVFAQIQYFVPQWADGT